MDVSQLKYGVNVSTPAKPSIRKVMLTLRVEPELSKRLKQEAEKSGLTPSEKLRRILDRVLPEAA